MTILSLLPTTVLERCHLPYCYSLRLLDCTYISRENDNIGFLINKEILKHSPRKTRFLLRELHYVKSYDT